MLIKIIYMFFAGYVTVSIEGFFVERFLNICRNKQIILQDLHRENSTYVKVKILKSDFKEIRHIAKTTKCKVKIEKKSGMPFFVNRYRKRKIFAVALFVIAIFIFIMTKFIWNIQVYGNHEIPKEEIVSLVNNYGISIGKLKSKINTEKVSNAIRLERQDLSWIGISIKGTNAIVTIEEAIKMPEIIDKNQICDIVATKDAEISKIVVQSGTARVKVGDIVKKGDLLVEGVMESELTDTRQVHSEADVFGKFVFEKEKTESFLQNIKVETGKKEEKNEICINKFKINFNKGVSKFKNYDTITTNKKVKLFSNFYLPIEIIKKENIEIENKQKTYSEQELKEKIENELSKEMETEYKISQYDEKNVKKDVYTNVKNDSLNVKLVYEIQEKIGEKRIK